MESQGSLKDVQRDYITGKLIISFLIDDCSPEEIERLRNCERLMVKAEKQTKKRSLSANAYFHVLVNKIAASVGSSNTEIKNRLIREYGAFEFIDGQIPTFSIKAEYEDRMLNNESIHVKPIGREFSDGCERVRFAFMRGSHTYTTEEMSRLIDGTVNEAKECGIETLTPAELKRMKDAWRSS